MRRRRGTWAFVLAALAATAVLPVGPATAEQCPLDGLALQPTDVTTPDGVTYRRWSGHIPSWDGVPLDVDVSVPAGDPCGRALVAFAHGWTDSKHVWQSETAAGRPEDPNRAGYNNVAFVDRGYAVLNYTARGWHGSCGPASSADPAGSPLGLPPECTGGNPLAPTREYWIHLSDLRYEVRDAQWLVGRLVDTGLVDPGRIGVTGGSYGGGLAWLAALANDRVMCGGRSWDPANGQDPCAGRAYGELVPWRSPRGVPLSIAAAVPEYTWASLVNVLLPNGRASSEAPGAPPHGDLREPIGNPLESYLYGLFAAAYTPPAVRNGFFKPPTAQDDTSAIPEWVAIVQAGINTVSVSTPPVDAIAANALSQLDDFKSPLTDLVPFNAEVPVLQLQGFTDPLFPPIHALMMWNKAKAYSPDYPIALFLADYGHVYSSNRANVPAAFNPLANAFLDHHLQGLGAVPRYGVTAALTRCTVEEEPDLVTFHGESLAALAGGALELVSDEPGETTNVPSGTEGPATDPVANGAAGPGVFGTRCPYIPETTDPGQGAWEFDVDRDVTLMGQPVVRLAVSSTGPDTALHVRLWDVSPDGMQALVSRGTYRFAQEPSPEPSDVAMEISANAWRLEAGHRLKLEVTGADWPYLQLNRLPSTTTVHSVRVRLPTLEPAPGLPPQADGAAAPPSRRLPATGGGWAGLLAAALLGLAACGVSARRGRGTPVP